MGRLPSVLREGELGLLGSGSLGVFNFHPMDEGISRLVVQKLVFTYIYFVTLVGHKPNLLALTPREGGLI